MRRGHVFSRSWRLAAGIAALVVVTAACGGGDDESAGASSETTDAPTTVPATTAHGHDDAHQHDEETDAARPFDPDDPIDLSGVSGVSPEQQARAEDLLRRTLDGLPAFADVATAEAAGYETIGDGFTGYEHFMKWDAINDDVTFDPAHPESLVYRVEGGAKTLAAAMYMLPSQYTLENVPDIGGPLTQFHIHDNLCFTNSPPPGPRVIGLTGPDGTCANGVKLGGSAMMHVWVVPHPCGPFAALEGVGAGQILEGQERACDHQHADGFFSS